MSNLYDLMAKLQAIEEAAKFSEIPASQRKEKYPHGWKVTQKDLDDEEKEGKISHKDNLAKNNGTKKEDVEVDECGGDSGGMVQLSMQDLIKLVKGLEKGDHGHDEPLMGAPGDIIGSEDVGEEFANSAAGDAGPAIQGIDAVTQTGDDLASKGKASPAARAPGVNPLRPVSEELRTRLHQYYDYVKTR
jgi:hypothetical protein